MPAEFNSEKITDNSSLSAASLSQASPIVDSDDELMWELLSLYADGEASPAEAVQVEQMLRHDAEYARAYAFMRQAGSAVRAIVEVEPPAHLRDAILAKTSHRPTLTRRVAVAWGQFRAQFVAPVGRLTLAGGALASAALLIGLYVGHGTAQTEQADNGNIAALNGADGSGAHIALNRPAPASASAPTPPKYQLPDPMEFAPETAPAQRLDASVAQAALPAGKNETAKSNGEQPSAFKTNALPQNIIASAAARAGLASADTSGTVGAKKAVFAAKREKITIASVKPIPSKPASPSYDGEQTQNVYPMMDANVQHRTAAMIHADGSGSADADDLNDNTIVTAHDDTTPAGAASGDMDGENAPGEGHKIVGKLQLAKLPPSSRHILSPADVVRQVNATAALRYNAAADSTQHRPAEVPVMTLKY